MDGKFANNFGLNESYVEILRAQWIENPLSVAKEWRDFFEEKTPKKKGDRGANIEAKAVKSPPKKPQLIDTPQEEVKTEVLVGVHKKIAQNMEESLAVPTATSIRTIPMKVLEENRL